MRRGSTIHQIARWLPAFALALTLTAGAVRADTALAEAPIPPPPLHYVLDEPQVLSESARRKLEYLLVEHDRATEEQILVAIFTSLGDEDPVTRTTAVFKQWQIGQRGKDNGVLIAAYWKERKLRIEVGYGLEAILTDAKSKRIIEEILTPRLRGGDIDSAFLGAVREVLTLVESPLLTNPDAKSLLQTRERPARRLHASRGVWFSALFLFVVLGSIVWNLILAAEARFSSAGWSSYRRMPWKRRGLLRRSSGWGIGGWGGGGGSGWGGGGGGGFGGGGGSSGGGGASGSW